MLTERMQIQAIADHLANYPDPQSAPNGAYRASDFSEPWRTCWQAIHKVE